MTRPLTLWGSAVIQPVALRPAAALNHTAALRLRPRRRAWPHRRAPLRQKINPATFTAVLRPADAGGEEEICRAEEGMPPRQERAPPR